MAVDEGGILLRKRKKITSILTTELSQLSQGQRDYNPEIPTQFKIIYKKNQVSIL